MRVMHLRHEPHGRIGLELRCADAVADLLETYLHHPNMGIVICTDSVQIAHPSRKLGDLGHYKPSAPDDADYQMFVQLATYLKQLIEQANGIATPQHARPIWHDVVLRAVKQLCGASLSPENLPDCATAASALVASAVRNGLAPATSGHESQ